MSELPPPLAPVLESAAKELADATDPHPRIYEVPPEQGRQILSDLQSDQSVPRPEVDEEWVDVDAGEWGSVRTRIIRPKGAAGPLPEALSTSHTFSRSTSLRRTCLTLTPRVDVFAARTAAQ